VVGDARGQESDAEVVLREDGKKGREEESRERTYGPALGHHVEEA